MRRIPAGQRRAEISTAGSIPIGSRRRCVGPTGAVIRPAAAPLRAAPTCATRDLCADRVRAPCSEARRASSTGTSETGARGRSCWDAVAEVYDAVVESVFVEEFEVGADARGQGRFAAADDHGPDEQLAFVDQACCHGPGARLAPPMVRSLVAAAFSSWTASGSKSRSRRV